MSTAPTTKDRSAPSAPDPVEVLIKEARRRGRVRWILGCAALALMVSVVYILVNAGGNRSYSPTAARSRLVQQLGPQYSTTPVIRSHGARWLVSVNPSPDWEPSYQPLHVSIYRWVSTRWSRVASLRYSNVGYFGGVDGGVQVASLTRGSDPDFALWLQGADTQWLSVASHTGDSWHWDQFVGEEAKGALVAGSIRGRVVEAAVDACGCASGPETFAWYRYDGTLFVPTAPPGPAPRCAATAFTQVASRSRTPVRFDQSACLDGWAEATGTSGIRPVDGLFEQYEGRWVEIALSGHLVSPFSPPGGGDEYAIPFDVLQRLATRIGRSATWILKVPPLRSAAVQF